MLVNSKIFEKLELIKRRYEKYRFRKVMTLDCNRFDTYIHYRNLPDENFTPLENGTAWGKDGLTMWIKSAFTIPLNLSGKKVFIKYSNSNVETLFLSNGVHNGAFDSNHHVLMLDESVRGGEEYNLGFEAYSGHSVPGCHAGEITNENDVAKFILENSKTFEGIELCIEDELITKFIFDLEILLQQVQVLNRDDLRQAEIAFCMQNVFKEIIALPDETAEETWRPSIVKSCMIMQPLLNKKNGSTAPACIAIGHSHLDTAWQWTIDETIRKCARTFSSVLNLMDQYPDFTFMQSAPYHVELMQNNYPDIFSRIQKKVISGKWEPNGAMYIEPDCNLTSGESLVRQLLIGQNTTREFFGYTSDTLWLPDTFGYSVALPQLLNLANVKYFATTKIYWNDTNRFPYDSFKWKGLDGSSVITHFHKVHFHPDAATLNSLWTDTVQHKDVQDRFLAPFGYGDGGGGPMNEMIEEALRLKDLQGTPKTSFGTVSEFMNDFEINCPDLPTFIGELYLECHRGTLTSVSENKKMNRRCEIALHDAELLSSIASLYEYEYPNKEFARLWKTLLINQFHDILPGTSIAEVNDQALRELNHINECADKISKDAMKFLTDSSKFITVFNTLSWDRNDVILIPDVQQDFETNIWKSQIINDINDNKILAVSGIKVKALSSVYIELSPRQSKNENSSFTYSGNRLITPFAIIAFNPDGTICSLIDKRNQRELVGNNGNFNSFIIGEDVPTYWDNWDINEEQKLKRNSDNRLISRQILNDGEITMRLESIYKIGNNSTIRQIIAVYADSPRIDFETKVNWNEKHTLLRVDFNTSVFSEYVFNETQFGHISRPTHKNYSTDRAKFEVPNQKWSDLSDNGSGIAVLNDCKYGISVEESTLSLTLLKSGTHPDPRADEGLHTFTYSLLPHDEPFSVKNVVRSSYELNYKQRVCNGKPLINNQFLNIDKDNIILETIKKSEHGNEIILRFYEAGKRATKAIITFGVDVNCIMETNLLEERISDVDIISNSILLDFRPFEIKTIMMKFC